MRLSALALLLATAAWAGEEPRTHDASRDSSLLADLPPLVRAAVEATVPRGADPSAILSAVYEVSALRELDLGTLVVRSDARWFASFSRESRSGAPIVELRRWPGDTVVALYAVGPADPGAAWPPIPGARPSPVGSAAASAEWKGTLEDASGERPALWIERTIDGSPNRLAALILPGDAGLGTRGIAGLEAEARFLVSRIEVRPVAWRHETPLAAGASVGVPSAGLPPGDRSEATDAWQVSVGGGFTLGLPPGFRTYRLDAGVPAAEHVPGALLWLRGRFRDLSGQLVAVGDDRRYGYVASVQPLTAEWIAGAVPPRGAPGASLAVPRPLAAAQMAEAAGAQSASAERWSEPRFAGDWIVFRLRYAQHGVEVALPVLGGRRSPSLFWIGQAFRPAGWPPAPPPVDPSERFGIEFERLTPAGRKASPWLEGYLHVPGLRAEVSRGFLPAASLRSTDGFPVRFQDEDGRVIATLRPLAPADVAAWIAARPALAELPKPGRHRAARVLAESGGAHLFVDAAGYAFVFEIVPEVGTEIQERFRIMMESVRLDRR